MKTPFGVFLKEKRASRGYTLRSLGDILGCKHSTLASIESGYIRTLNRKYWPAFLLTFPEVSESILNELEKQSLELVIDLVGLSEKAREAMLFIAESLKTMNEDSLSKILKIAKTEVNHSGKF